MKNVWMGPVVLYGLFLAERQVQIRKSLEEDDLSQEEREILSWAKNQGETTCRITPFGNNVCNGWASQYTYGFESFSGGNEVVDNFVKRAREDLIGRENVSIGEKILILNNFVRQEIESHGGSVDFGPKPIDDLIVKKNGRCFEVALLTAVLTKKLCQKEVLVATYKQDGRNGHAFVIFVDSDGVIKTTENGLLMTMNEYQERRKEDIYPEYFLKWEGDQ